MGRYTGKTCRLLSMVVLTGSFFLVEISVGYITKSLALVGDSYHMLSDVIALLVGFASVRIAKMKSQKNTYGWARAEVVGALVNAVFLMALCFSIFVEALERIVHTEKIEDPKLLVIVGGIGLAINLIGLFLFQGHGHTHGHSHGESLSHAHSHSHVHPETIDTVVVAENQITVISNSPMADTLPEHQDGHSKPKASSAAQLNMRGVFLHVLGDALGSVIVIISALVVIFVEGDWKYKIDPVMSLILVGIILTSSIPLFKESAMILMQTVPTHIQVKELQEKLVNQVEGVLAVHEFHVWQLAGSRIIASAHIRFKNITDYMCVAEKVKDFFHHEGIHSTTIQAEFTDMNDCVLECGPDKSCYPDTCCGEKPKGIVNEAAISFEDETNVRESAQNASDHATNAGDAQNEENNSNCAESGNNKDLSNISDGLTEDSAQTELSNVSTVEREENSVNIHTQKGQ